MPTDNLRPSAAQLRQLANAAEHEWSEAAATAKQLKAKSRDAKRRLKKAKKLAKEASKAARAAREAEENARRNYRKATRRAERAIRKAAKEPSAIATPKRSRARAAPLSVQPERTVKRARRAMWEVGESDRVNSPAATRPR